MKLVSFRVQMFRNALDTGDIDVQPDVTCLVGKNESGKTAMLDALYRLKPVYADGFDSADHYPKWKWVEDRRRNKVNDKTPISAVFELDEADVAAVEKVAGVGTAPSSITTSRQYGSDRSFVAFEFEESKSLSTFVEAADLTADIRGELDLEDATKLKASITALKAKLTADEGGDHSVELAALGQLESTLDERLGKEKSMRGVVRNLLWTRVPRMFYFADYQYLPGEFELSHLNASDEEVGASPEQTARALLRMAGTDLKSLSADDYDTRKSELRAVGHTLSREVKKYWRQNPDLVVNIDITQKTVQHQNGQHAVLDKVIVEVEDTKNEFGNNFDQRSAGFKWFFSFLAAFNQFKEEAEDGKQVIVLLDEPAVSLHGHAQKDFLDFIDDRLAPLVQVIYTTHSPFLVQPNKLERVRVVEDKGPESGACVTAEAARVGADTLFPLQAALGYDIAQHLFIGQDNLVVEGLSDFIYLEVMSEHLEELGRTHLDPRWRILPAGSVTAVPTFVALVGGALDVTVLVDGGTPPGRLLSMVTAGQLKEKRLITCATVTGAKDADVEDLFGVEDYLALYNATFGTDLTEPALEPGVRIVDRIGRTLGAPFERHGKPANTLQRQRDTFLPAFSETTKANFERLFGLINATLSTRAES